MSTAKPVNIKTSDVTFGQVFIDSPELVEALIKDQENVLKFLEEKISHLSLDKITVDECGRLIIDDENFRQALEEIVQDETVMQTVCGFHC
ncbi:hypothetical protein [Crocosphaera chwakensis]|uniref:Uncharacterized protein n=1 Tax=Crocosphaera chwakensis CCY0110 TaxID=391612 RepID=A3IYA9_9CHRO|nr:hypothetical protein [Crocosphaera chwakensis]EAZ88555.1 hypothetical protein CY0110_02717 [Crocosphaera chwakensis CCY0110]